MMGFPLGLKHWPCCNFPSLGDRETPEVDVLEDLMKWENVDAPRAVTMCGSFPGV